MSFSGIGVLAIIIFFSLELFLRKNRNTNRKPSSNSGGTTTLIIFSYIAVFTAPFLLDIMDLTFVFPDEIRSVGTIAIIIGFAMRIASMHVLGEFNTRKVRMVKQQRLTTKGPYLWIRHPDYLGSLLIWFGIELVFGNVFGFLIVMGLMLSAYLYRMRVEEISLQRIFKQSYTTYKKKSWRLLPFMY